MRTNEPLGFHLVCRAVERPGTDVVAVMSQLLRHPCAVNLTEGGVMKHMVSPQPARELPHQAHRRRYRISISTQDSWPLRLAAVDAGKWGCGRPGRRSHCDAYELVSQDGAGDHRQELSIVA